MKLRKRRISILLSMLLLLSVFQPAAALDVDPDFEQIYEIGTRLLGDIEHEKELYGLGGVNFDNLYIGEYIPAYIAKETGLVLSDVRNYPVLENGEWVATLTCSKSDGIWNAQLSNTFVPELPEISANDSLQFVFEGDTTYLIKNTSIYNMTYKGEEERAGIASASRSTILLDGQKLVNKREIKLGMYDGVVHNRSSSLPGQATLQIPLVSKFQSQAQYNMHMAEKAKPAGERDGSKIIGACWAASAKAIGQKFGINKSIDEIYEETGNYTKYLGHNFGGHVSALSSIFGLYTDIHINGLYYVNIQEALAADRPVSGYVRLVLDDGTISGHMVAIRGYVSYYNSSEYVGSFTYVENETYPATSVAVSVTHAQSTLAQLDYYYLGKLRGAFTQFCISSDEIF